MLTFAFLEDRGLFTEVLLLRALTVAAKAHKQTNRDVRKQKRIRNKNACKHSSRDMA